MKLQRNPDIKLGRYVVYLFLLTCCYAIPRVCDGSQKPRSLSDQDGQAIVQLLFERDPNTSKPLSAKQPLIIKANVSEVACARAGDDLVRCKAKLNLEFSNTGSSPVIFVNPDEDALWHGGSRLALTKNESEIGRYVYDVAHWQSVVRSTEYRKLAASLDQRTPDEGFIRIMAPGELWDFSSSIQISFRSEKSRDTKLGVAIGWREIEKLTSPLWMRVSYELWPFNVENFRPNLGRLLRKRWRSFGTLYLDDDSGKGFSHGRITSEPFELDLTKIKLN